MALALALALALVLVLAGLTGLAAADVIAVNAVNAVAASHAPIRVPPPVGSEELSRMNAPKVVTPAIA